MSSKKRRNLKKARIEKFGNFSTPLSSFGEPRDIGGQCNAKLYIADNYCDNHATMRCQLVVGHDGEHKETYDVGDQNVCVTWTVDERNEKR
jgi:hypothetical protein